MHPVWEGAGAAGLEPVVQWKEPRDRRCSLRR
jgi:hypothetical protein